MSDITDKQKRTIAYLEQQDYVPKFTGKTKQEAREYIGKWEEYLFNDKD